MDARTEGAATQSSQLEANLSDPRKRDRLDEHKVRNTEFTVVEKGQLDVSGYSGAAIMAAVFTGMFLSFLDTSIVAVALATIANEFQEFDQSTWVFTSYMLSYMAFGIILARLSDIFGMKTIEIISLSIFFFCSLACALSRNMTELIIFRAIQGIGGSGMFSTTTIIGLKCLPTSKTHTLATWIGLTQVVAVILGPVLGGVITHHHYGSTWRWIFWLNLPLCGLALLALAVAWPRHSNADRSKKHTSWWSVDLVGAALLLSSTLLLVTALQEAGTRVYTWNSPLVVACLAVAGVSILLFISWELVVEAHLDWRMQSIFPVRLVADRVMAVAISVTLLNGFVWYLAVVNLPNRFQMVNGDGPVTAGLRLLPMMVSAAFGTFVSASLSSRRNLTSWTTIGASGFQLFGYGLMTTLPSERGVASKTYGFEIFLGFGFGLSITSTTMMVLLRYLSHPNTAVMQGCLTQMRALGGSVGLAVGTIIFNGYAGSRALASVLTPAELEHLYRSPLAVSTLSSRDQVLVGHTYAQAFSQQMRIATYAAAASLLLSFATLERHPPLAAAQQAQDCQGSRTEDVEKSSPPEP